MKLIVWDLDNTIWDGIFVYDGEKVKLKQNIINIIKELDNRGFLQSIISRNPKDVLGLLDKLKIKDYFVFPQISWETKDIMFLKLINLTNILPKDITFIDDDKYNLELIKTKFKDITCINIPETDRILDLVDFKRIRKIRDSERKRFFKEEEERIKDKDYKIDNNKFLDELNMILTIKKMESIELENVIELINRTNQLNSTGNKFNNVIEFLSKYNKYNIIIGYPEDRYGAYGLTLVLIFKIKKETIMVDELIVSCRILDRNILPDFLGFVQTKWKTDKIKIKYKKTRYNSVLKQILFDIGFELIEHYKYPDEKYLKIENYIISKTKVNITHDI